MNVATTRNNYIHMFFFFIYSIHLQGIFHTELNLAVFKYYPNLYRKIKGIYSGGHKRLPCISRETFSEASRVKLLINYVKILQELSLFNFNSFINMKLNSFIYMNAVIFL